MSVLMSNYPLGAKDNPNAPYNKECKNGKLLEFDCEVEVVLRKKIKLTTNNTSYEDGVWYVNEDEDLVKRYEEKELTIKDLIGELKRLAKIRLGDLGSVAETCHLKDIIKACDGWEVLETRCE